MQHIYRGAVTLAVVTALAGCSTAQVTAMAKSSPSTLEMLQVASAGHTGCLPEDNQVSIIWMKQDRSALWKSTCKGKTYVCSALGASVIGESFSCAPEAQ